MWGGGYFGDAGGGAEGVEVLVDLGFVVELGKLGGGFFQLGRIAFGGVGSVFGQVDLPEGARA
jgi:hypothetical protein